MEKRTISDTLRKMKLKPAILYLSVICLGVIIYGIVVGFKLLNPQYVDWLFEEMNDAGEMFLGWKSYRYSDWQFPFGLQDNLAYPEKSSICFNMGLPLGAFIFKLFSSILPHDFQFFGLWGLMDFLLVGLLTTRIVWNRTGDYFSSLLSGVFLQISQVLIVRMFVQTGLSSTWIVLLALEPAFSKNKFKAHKAFFLRMVLLGFLASSIHMYYLAMCGICVFGLCITEIVCNREIKKAACGMGIYIGICIIMLYLWGAFSTNSAYAMTNVLDPLGVVSFNLINLFNPRYDYSALLAKHQVWDEPHQVDGYLGAGAILLLLVSVICILNKSRQDFKNNIRNNKYNILSLTIIFIVSLIFALSYRVTLGKWILFEIPIPKFVHDFWSIFRATSRFAWILDMIIIIGSIIVISKKMPKYSCAIIISICALIQIYDFHYVLDRLHERFSETYVYESPITEISDSGIWKELENNKTISTVVITKPLWHEELYALTDWVIDSGKRQTYYYFGRPMKTYQKNTEYFLENPDETMIFIFKNTDYETCRKYDLNYYQAYNYIIGYSGELETYQTKIDINDYSLK